MSYRSPLGNNYGWTTNGDHRYVSRELSEADHAALAVVAVAQDPELRKLEQEMGCRVILAVRLGKHTLSARIYKLEQVEHRPDNLPSRMAERDTAAFMVFNQTGGVDLLEGRLRDMAQGSIPAFYAERRLNPQKVQALNGMQLQLTGFLPKSWGLPKPSAPLSPHGGYEEVPLGPEPPTLEPA